MKTNDKKQIPSFKNIDAAEKFIESADLTEFDLRSFKPMQFEFKEIFKTLNMRISKALLNVLNESIVQLRAGQIKHMTKKILKRINVLVKDSQRTAFEGIGKTEPLKANLSDFWSCRIDEKHRLIYEVTDERISIIQCRFYY